MEKDFSKVRLRVRSRSYLLRAAMQNVALVTANRGADPQAVLFFRTFTSWLPLEGQEFPGKCLFLKLCQAGASSDSAGCGCASFRSSTGEVGIEN